MPMTCITCGSTMPDISEFCPSCGRAVQLAQRVEAATAPGLQETRPATESQALTQSDVPFEPSTSPDPSPAPPPTAPLPSTALVAWNDRWIAAAAYLTFIPAVIFLFIKPYAKRRFVRFHSLQSVFFWIAVVVLLGLGVLASTFGFLLLWLFTGTLVFLAMLLTWLVLAIKALQGEWFRLPGVGHFSEQFVTAE